MILTFDKIWVLNKFHRKPNIHYRFAFQTLEKVTQDTYISLQTLRGACKAIYFKCAFHKLAKSGNRSMINRLIQIVNFTEKDVTATSAMAAFKEIHSRLFKPDIAKFHPSRKVTSTVTFQIISFGISQILKLLRASRINKCQNRCQYKNSTSFFNAQSMIVVKIQFKRPWRFLWIQPLMITVFFC